MLITGCHVVARGARAVTGESCPTQPHDSDLTALHIQAEEGISGARGLALRNRTNPRVLPQCSAKLNLICGEVSLGETDGVDEVRDI